MTLEEDRKLYAELEEEQKRLLQLKKPVSNRLIRAGDLDHSHGRGTYESPMVWHKHEHQQDNHTHTEAQAAELKQLRLEANLRMP